MYFITLVITIIVMIILAGTVILSLSNTNIVERSKEATTKTNLANYKEKYNMWLIEQQSIDSNFDKKNLNIDKTSTGTTLNDIFGNKLSDKDKEIIKIVKGVFIYATSDAGEIEIAKELGIDTVIPTDESWFTNCTLTGSSGYDYGGFQKAAGDNACFDTSTGIIYSVNLPEGVTEVTIPKTINGVTVTGVAGEYPNGSGSEMCFMPTTLTKVTIPTGITIHAGAFGASCGDYSGGHRGPTKIEVVSDGAIKFDTGGTAMYTDSKIVVATGSIFAYGGFYFGLQI